MTGSLPFLLGVLGCQGPETPSPCATRVPGSLCTVAGSGAFGKGADGLPALATDLYQPIGIAFDPDGRLVFADFNNMYIRRLRDDATLEVIVGSGEHKYAVPGAVATESPLENPIDVSFLDDGRLLIAELHAGRILAVTDGLVEVVAGTTEVGFSGDGGPAVEATLSETGGVLAAPGGGFYIADSYNHCVRAVDGAGVIRTLAGTGVAGYEGNASSGGVAMFNYPQRMALDGDVLYVADWYNHLVRAVDVNTGRVWTVAGTTAAGWEGDGGPAELASLNYPQAVEVGPDGALWIADSGNNVIRRVDADGVISTPIGTGTAGRAGDAGPMHLGQLNAPAGLRFSPDGDLYLADLMNSQVRVVWDPISALP